MQYKGEVRCFAESFTARNPARKENQHVAIRAEMNPQRNSSPTVLNDTGYLAGIAEDLCKIFRLVGKLYAWTC